VCTAYYRLVPDIKFHKDILGDDATQLKSLCPTGVFDIEDLAGGKKRAVVGDAREVGSPMPGLIVTVAVQAGDVVTRGQKLLSLEAMKMETTVYAERDGKIAEVLVAPGTPVEAGELVVKYADG
jgi:biotin carboxyl carrier protein